MSERWRKIPGWPYQASSLGRVRSLPRQMAGAGEYGGQVLTPAPDRDGYLRVTLTDGRRRKRFGVHTLVALAWHGPPEVLHGPGGQQDNTPGNLRWGSRRDNERDKRSGQIPAVRPGSMELAGQEQAEAGIRTCISHPLNRVAPVIGDVQG